MRTTNRILTDHLSTFLFVLLIGAQVTMLSYGARCVTTAASDIQTTLASVATATRR